ncbi:hypothetical protein JCM9492_00350 [Aquifex pyrophilus]
MNLDEEKARDLLLVITIPMLILNSVAYSLDILLDLKVVDMSMDLLYEQVFLLGYIIGIHRFVITNFLVSLYLLLLSMLIVKNKWQAISSNPTEILIKVLSAFALVILFYFLFIEEKRALERLIGKSK